ncbi:hypothetical protein [Aquimarina sp. SS2-1]|uniref:hypothetical protein n=1 Tax=Aquimarina besae TaxID=3342247 RepID=UPI00366CD362
MGYAVETIFTNGRKVSEVFGSKNYDLINIIPDYSEYDFILEDYFDLSTGKLSSKRIMQNIIDGETENLYTDLILDKEVEKFAISTLGAVYGYLQRDVCLHYGKIVNRNNDNWPMFTQHLSDFENRTRSYWKTPRSKDFPHLFFILIRELEDYKKLYFDTLAKKYPNNIELKKDMQYVFDKAKELNLNIFFCNS